MPKFQYHPAILEKFPTIIGGVILGTNLTNTASAESLGNIFVEEQKKVIEAIGDTPLSNILALAAWRRAFSQFGVEPTKYRSAAEALLRRLTKKGDIPSINLLVDIGNLVSIRYRLPVAVFDTRQIQGAITVHFADGSEHFTTLNEDETDHPDIGEVVFSDENKEVVARRWCWRQSNPSAAQLDSTEVIVTIEGHHDTARTEIESAIQDLLGLLNQYAGGSYQMAVLDKDNLAI
jgi:DNA/RNA-binding domain of Phe-tRNA-synthetase-like protein